MAEIERHLVGTEWFSSENRLIYVRFPINRYRLETTRKLDGNHSETTRKPLGYQSETLGAE